jgi:hypothetical protein
MHAGAGIRGFTALIGVSSLLLRDYRGRGWDVRFKNVLS